MSDSTKNITPANLSGSSAGFTIIELLVTISLIGIISISILAAMGSFFVGIVRNDEAIEMSVASQDLLRSTVEELRYGAGVRQSNSITDPNGPSGGWNTSNEAFVIIISSPAKNSAGNYIIDSITGDPYNNELVYFKEGDTLYKRTLANTEATGNTEKSTCPKSIASASCPQDKELTENLENMVFTLYDQDDVVTTDPLVARSVKIDLSMSKDTLGDPLTLENSIRVTLRNNF